MVVELALLTLTVLLLLIYLQLKKLLEVQEVMKDYLISSKVLLEMIAHPQVMLTEEDLARVVR